MSTLSSYGKAFGPGVGWTVLIYKNTLVDLVWIIKPLFMHILCLFRTWFYSSVSVHKWCLWEKWLRISHVIVTFDAAPVIVAVTIALHMGEFWFQFAVCLPINRLFALIILPKSALRHTHAGGTTSNRSGSRDCSGLIGLCERTTRITVFPTL